MPVFYVPFLLYVPSQRQETKAGFVPGKKMGSGGISGQFPFMHTQACILYDELTYADPFRVSHLFNGKRSYGKARGYCMWERRSVAVSEKFSLTVNYCVAGELGRLLNRGVFSCLQPSIVIEKVVTSSSLNLSPYFALPS